MNTGRNTGQFFNPNTRRRPAPPALPEPSVPARPEIAVCGPNLIFARMMLDNAYGCTSAQTFLTSYMYNGVLCHCLNAEASEIFMEAVKCEMLHLETFLKLAHKLGEDPRAWSRRGSRRVWWSPSFVKYCPNLCAALKNAVCAEKRAIAKYESQLSKIDDENVCAVLRCIIEDKRRQERCFTELCERCCEV